MANLAFLRSHRASAQSPVDLAPWQTAQTLASLAVTAEEHEYAREAERLADHEVDQAFAAALRAAQLRTRHQALTGNALALSQRVAQLQQEVSQDQSLVNSLKAKAAAPAAYSKNVVTAAVGSDALQVAQAQLGLDSDELTDAQRDSTAPPAMPVSSFRASSLLTKPPWLSTTRSSRKAAKSRSLRSSATLPCSAASAPGFSQRDRYASLQQALAETKVTLPPSPPSTTPSRPKRMPPPPPPPLPPSPTSRTALPSARFSPSTTTVSRPTSSSPRSIPNGATRSSSSTASFCTSSCSPSKSSSSSSPA